MTMAGGSLTWTDTPASLTADMRITTDEKSRYRRTMKSGYGFQEKVTTHVSTNQSSAVTSAQNAVTYFPEFQYERFWRLLERMNGGYDMTHEFKKNGYSTYERRTHLHQFGIGWKLYAVYMVVGLLDTGWDAFHESDRFHYH